MTLAAGTKLGPYEVQSPLGAGGMGEVWRAKDLRVDRTVALKVLPEEFFEGEERRARFAREAKLLASLNHPGIATLYSFEEISGRNVLTMELVEGEDLSVRIASGPLPLEESLSIARQIAEALEAAHEKGIVHRDLKPANVKVTPQGRVKVLDFGLAKIFDTDASPSSPSISYSPTLTARATAAGVILGTAAYMAPEQARGKAVDKRADVWAFGCVLFEMLTGKRAFQGETVSDTLASILKEDPDWAALPPGTPEKVREILRKCLRRDAKQRLHDVADARLDLEELSSSVAMSSSVHSPFEEKTASPSPTGGRSASTEVERGSKKNLSFFLPWALAAAFAAAAGALALRARAPEARVVRARITPPEGASFWLEPNGPGPAVVSPDGRKVAFTAADGAGKVNLYVRSLDASEPQMLGGTEGAQYPFWSPDSRAIGFFTPGKLKTVDLVGGSPLTLCPVSEGKGGSWGPSGTILFAPSPNGPLSKVSDKGGDPVVVTKIDGGRGDNSHRHPRFLPDGKHFLYVARNSASASEGFPIVFASLDGGAEKVLLRSPATPQYASGRLLYLRETTLMARPFDPARGTFLGDGLPVADRIAMPSVQTGSAVFSASENGVLVTQSARGDLSSRLQWRTRDGKPDGFLGEPGEYQGVVFSPDGKLAAVTALEGGGSTYDLWILDVARGVRTRFTFDPGNDVRPVWSPDGKSIVFASDRKGHYDLYRKSLEGAAEEEPLVVSDTDKVAAAWTPDGRFLVFGQDVKGGGTEIRTLALDGSKKEDVILKTKASAVASPLSPDGRWLPVSSDESGRWEVYVTSFPKAGRKWQVSTGGGAYAFWRADGKEIVYHDQLGTVRACEVEIRPDAIEVGPGRPIMYATGPSPAAPSFCPTADHQRFLVVGEGQKPNPFLDLLLNWPVTLTEKR